MTNEQLLDAFHEIIKVTDLKHPAFSIACEVIAEHDLDAEKQLRINNIVSIIKGADDDEDCAKRLIGAGFFQQKDISRTLQYQTLESRFKSSEANLAALSEVVKEAVWILTLVESDEGDWWSKLESFLTSYGYMVK